MSSSEALSEMTISKSPKAWSRMLETACRNRERRLQVGSSSENRGGFIAWSDVSEADTSTAPCSSEEARGISPALFADRNLWQYAARFPMVNHV